MPGFLQLHITAALRALVHDAVGGQGADHLAAVALPCHAAGQVHQAATFGIGGQAAVDGAADVLPQGGVGLQSRHLGLGKAAADEQTVDVGGQLAVVQGIEG